LEEPSSSRSTDGDKEFDNLLHQFSPKFEEAMDDDFNTPKALATFHEVRGKINKLLVKGLSDQAKKNAKEFFSQYGEPLGLFQISQEEWHSLKIDVEEKINVNERVNQKIQAEDALQIGVEENISVQDWVELKIQERKEARDQKDFATADKIRQELAAKNIILEDRPDGTTRWKR
jgi:cysteinyl-tRNA synthetase